MTKTVSFHTALSERYLSYALSTITSRSLPDVRDGLKPVHRRLVYAMQQLKLNPESGFKKCARVVGDVMGKFHPHGDAAIYAALVRLAQEFSSRYPLIEGQGNFGNIDGDAAAAMRYTEARLTPLALLLLEDLDVSSFRRTYDGEEEEPIVLPARFPNLLANGTTGIAVGMATSIPPHNLEELLDAAITLIKKPDATLEDFPGPDFPTGGILVSTPEEIQSAYQEGRGRFRVRARWHKEELKGGAYKVIVTEIPYQVEKASLIEKIDTLIQEKKLPFLEDVQDESAQDIRIVLTPRGRNVKAENLMESLFKFTDLDIYIPLNLNILDPHHIPMVVSLKEALKYFLDYRLVVLCQKIQKRCEQILHRLEILGGLLLAYQHLDAIIRIIRDEDHPKDVLKARYQLTDLQAESILNMRLRSLRKLQEKELREEHATLEKEKDHLHDILENPKKQWGLIEKDLKEIKKKFGKTTLLGARKTTFDVLPSHEEAIYEIEKEQVTFVCSQMSWVRILKGHELTDIKYKEGDAPLFTIETYTNEKIVLFGSNGKAYQLDVHKLSRSRHGDPLRLIIDLPHEDVILNAFSSHDLAKEYLFVSQEGKGFRASLKTLQAQTKTGKQILVCTRALACLPVEGEWVGILGENRKLLIFPLDQIPILTRGKGVKLQKYRSGGASDLQIFSKSLFYYRHEKKIALENSFMWEGRRGGTGRLAPVGVSRENKFKP